MKKGSIERFFSESSAFIDGNWRLRTPQIEGHKAAVEHFSGECAGEPAIEQIPVGCGKSGLIAIMPFGIARGRVLVIAPNLTIRGQLMNDLDASNPASFYRRTHVINDSSAIPQLALLNGEANFEDILGAHIVVTNIQQLAATATGWLPAFPNDFFDLIIVDEGHHNAARSWQGVFDRFPRAKVISLTATPFRGDERPVHGIPIYRYSFVAAMRTGYIKRITAVNLRPARISFTYEGDERCHSLEEVLELKEEGWFSRGVALAPECNRHIVRASIQWLMHLRQINNFRHQLIAVTCSVIHAEAVCSLYREHNLEARVIHSELNVSERQEILTDLRNGTIDAVIQVELLGEGFDHPPLSVAAIFRPFRSLNAYIQFVGRIMRVNFPTIGHPDNTGVLVSHIGMNQDSNWSDFKGIDSEELRVIRGWLRASELAPNEDGKDRQPPDRKSQMEVIYEVIEWPTPDPYLEAVESTAINAFDGQATQSQRRRQELRQKLDAQTRAAAAKICKVLGESPRGKRIARLVFNSDQDNYGAVVAHLHRSVNEQLGIQPGTRHDLSAERIESILPELERLANTVQDRLRKRMITEHRSKAREIDGC